MRRISSSVTKRGQVTLPAAVRRRLGIDAPGRVVFEVDDDGVRLAPEEYTLESIFGILPPLPEGMSIDDAIELAKEEHVLKIAREGS
jgi:AbrB family looped-hinge helix DNA binding protein